MFTKIVTSALIAGFAAGLIAGLLQLVFVQPVLLHSELYESGELVHFGAEAGGAHPEVGGIDIARDFLSVLFAALIYTGYGFLLIAGMALASDRGVVITARTGVIWGIAGFVAAQMAPAFSLPPELPGSAAAEVTPRQIWWFATVAATAAGLALLAFGRGIPLWGAGVLLILAPHIVGAPHPADFVGPVPPELSAMFAARALGTGLAAWSVLGLACGYMWQRETT